MNEIRTREYLSASCVWPELAEPYDTALHQAVDFVLGHVPDVTAIMACGSILRGEPSASSDLDIYVLREKSERQRLQRWFNGVPAEIFVNPPHQVRKYLDGEQREGRPITAHMLSTGHVVLAIGDALAELCATAEEILQGRPDPAPQRLTSARYMAALTFEDATDIWETRPEAARMILNTAVRAMLHYAYLAANRYIPRDKDLLIAMEDLDASLAGLAWRYYSTSSGDEALEAAHGIAERTVKTFGFFEWESVPEVVGPEG